MLYLYIIFIPTFFPRLNVDDKKFGKPGYFWTLQSQGNSEQWLLWVISFFLFVLPLSQLPEHPRSLEPSFHGHGADISPPPVQVSRSLLDGIALGVCGTSVTIMQQDLTQVEDRGNTCAVFLYVSLKLLQRMRDALFKYFYADGRNCGSIC